MSDAADKLTAELVEAKKLLRELLARTLGYHAHKFDEIKDAAYEFLNCKSKSNTIAVLEDLRDELRKWEKHRFGIADELSSYQWRKEGDKQKERADVLDTVIAERVFTPTHLHKKSSRMYQVIAHGTDEFTRITVIFRSEDGDWFTRLAAEFDDCFVELKDS